ncbi:Dimethylaniline monooxygenase [N-oxide-forming] 3, partial [Stegodyphus mimosarum]
MLKEEGLNPICFEQTDKPGGTWNYREVSNMEGVASIMPTRHSEMYQYIKDFASEHDCFKHIQFNMMVTCVKRSKDYDETGRWVVT